MIFIKIGTGQRTREQVIARISEVDNLIDSLFTTAMTSVQNGSIAEYEIDSGQSTSKVKYTTLSQVTDAISKYEKIRSLYENKLQSRVVRLMDSKNF